MSAETTDDHVLTCACGWSGPVEDAWSHRDRRMDAPMHTESTAWFHRPLPPRISRWLLFSRVELSLWTVPALLIFSAAFHGGKPGEFSSGGAAIVALLWGMGKLREYADEQ